MQQFHIPGRYLEYTNEFFSLYDVQEFITCSERKLRNKDSRICRFCGKDANSTSFDKTAHLVPELLGNHVLFSDFECDTCNGKFGREYESHLSYFLGISNTLCGIHGKRKIPSFTAPGYKLTASHSTTDNPYGTVTLERNNITDDTFVVDVDKGKTTVNYRSNSYIPLKVYKSLLKIALSCLPEKYLTEYSLAFRYLMSEEMDKDCKQYNQGYYYNFSPSYALESPICLLYNKRTPDKNLFTHIFLLASGNSIFQIVIPLHVLDTQNAIGQSVRGYFSPPVFFQDMPELNEIRIDEYTLALSSTELCKDGWGQLEFNVDENGTVQSDIGNNKIVKIEIIRGLQE